MLLTFDEPKNLCGTLNIFFKLIYLFLALWGLHCFHCCAGFSLVVASRGYSPVAVRGLLPAGASLVAWAQQLWLLGSRAQGSNPCPLHGQVDSLLLGHQGSPGTLNTCCC